MRLPSYKRISIVMRIALVASLSLILFAIAMLVFIKSDIERGIYRETDSRVQVAQNTMTELLHDKGTPSLRDGKLRIGRWIANDDNSLVDHVRALTGADATLFAILGGKPIRVTTTIVKLDGSGRNVHTELLGPARAAFDAGRSFAGVSPVAGRRFLNRYDALRDARGRVVGIIYTGIPLTTMEHTNAQAMRMVILATGLALLASLSLIYAVMRPLQRAFRNTVAMAQGLAGGDVEQRSEIVSEDELGQVSLAFREMIKYQQRMASVADALASGDFSVEVTPVSERDRLGLAFAHMSRKLNGLVQELERSAMTDSLTQLGNRRAFDARVRAELSRAARKGASVSLALVDIDNFKAVNDENGHQHGDVVLAKLGAVLGRLRSEDSAFRLGGDEFAILFADGSARDAQVAVERVRQCAQEELYGTTVSIGLATSPHGFTDGDTLQRQADAALYVCKQRGRNNVVTFDDAREGSAIPQQMNVHAVTRLIAEGDLQIAFQPIWDFGTREILGFEALARPDAKYGLAGPQEAFDIATEIGRVHDLDRVCRTAALTAAVDLPPGMLFFLNVSPESLARGAVVPQALAAALAAVGLAPERTVLEITERFAGPSQPVIAAAGALQQYGFKLALDDTGAGNAGLEYLSRLKVDYIKIDGAIVAKAVDDTAARGVIAAIIALAATTDAYVIAEGIENFEMLDAVRGLGLRKRDRLCGVQGYFLGRPGSIASALEKRDAVARDLARAQTAVHEALSAP